MRFDVTPRSPIFPLLSALALSVAGLAGEAAAQDFEVTKLRPPVFVQTPGGNLPVARGDRPTSSWIVRVGADGGFVFESKRGAKVSVIGPALVLADKGADDRFTFTPVFGDYRIHWPSKRDGQWKGLEGSDFTSFLEISASGRVRRLRQLRSNSRYEGLDVKAGEGLDIQDERSLRSNNVAEEIALLESRHGENEFLWVPAARGAEEETDPRLNAWTEFEVHGGVATLSGTIALDKNSGTALAGGAAIGRSFYLTARPKWRRIDYLYAPHLKVGLGVVAFSTEVAPTGAAPDQVQGLLTGAQVGVSWVGLSFEGLVGYEQTASDLGFSSARPWGYRLRAGYDFDFKDLTDTDFMLGVGGSFHRLSFRDSVGGALNANAGALSLRIRFLF
mgnify:CR=1 FL=1